MYLRRDLIDVWKNGKVDFSTSEKKEASSSLPLINLHNPNAKPWILMAQSCDPQIPRETLALKEGIPCIHCPVLSVHVPMKWVNELTMWPASPQGGRGEPMHWRKYTLYSVPRSPRTMESQWSLCCYAGETTECYCPCHATQETPALSSLTV